jgi:hypothetical protein
LAGSIYSFNYSKYYSSASRGALLEALNSSGGFSSADSATYVDSNIFSYISLLGILAFNTS